MTIPAITIIKLIILVSMQTCSVTFGKKLSMGMEIFWHFSRGFLNNLCHIL